MSALQQAQQLLNAGRIAEAAAALQQYTRRYPKDARAAALFALITANAGDHERGRYFADRALAMAPSDAEVLQLYAGVMATLGDRLRAEAAYRRVLAAEPGRLDTLLGLATLLSMHDAHAEVEALCGQALRVAGEGTAAVGALLAAARLARGHADQAVGVLEEALAVAPDDPDLLFARAGALNSAYGVDPQTIARAHRAFGRTRTLHAGDGALPALAPRGTSGPIRVGFVSADLRQHPVAFFLEPLLRNLDRARFEPVAFCGQAARDAVTDRLRPLFASWHDIRALADDQAAALVRTQRIDLLFDLGGLTAGERLGVFALRAAPAQATWLGYPNTTGLPAMDFRLVDSVTDPEASEVDERCTERLVRMDGCFICYGPSPSATSAPFAADRAGPVTFASFNALHKLTPPAVALWSRIVHAVPGSRLLLKAAALAEESTRADVAARFAAAGLPADRLELLAWVQSDPIRLYHRVDIALDPFPYNGTTTTCDALWMGVPLVTLAGRTHAGRVGASLLTHVGLPELVAADEADYAAIATSLAHDAPRRADLRRTLRQRVTATIADGPAFARRFERALDRMMAALAPAAH